MTYEVVIPRRPPECRGKTSMLIHEVLDEADRHLSGWNPQRGFAFNTHGNDQFAASACWSRSCRRRP
jgi:hypothetical protein